MKAIMVFIIVISYISPISAQWNFQTSLHKTRNGFNNAYCIENRGMETITGIAIDQLDCKKCHSVTGYYPNGTPVNPVTYTPVCVDCHDFQTTLTVPDEACFTCHMKQMRERELYAGIDVHSNAGLTCISCHSKEELHGDDLVAYTSMKEPGAVKVKCTDCHTQLSNNSSHNHHLTKVDCAACHAVSVYSCAGCHFETYLGNGKKRFISEFKDYRLLVKKDGMVNLGAISTHSYNSKTNYIISSTHSHIIKKNATSCSDCHRAMGNVNLAIKEYNDTGFITVAKWDSVEGMLNVLNGVIPVPADWQQSLKIDHVTYTGDSSIFPSDPELWAYLKSGTDNAHLYYAEALDSVVMEKLGFTRFPTDVENEHNGVPGFRLNQNYPNPFNSATKIGFRISDDRYVSLKVFDALGTEIACVVDEFRPAGFYEVTFNASLLSSGVYYYQLVNGDYIETKKMILLR